MNIRSRVLGLGRRLADPADWTRRQTVGEAALSAFLALTAAVFRLSESGGWPAAAGIGLAVAVVSLLRRAMPATALVAAGVLSGVGEGGLLLIVVSWSAGRRIEAMPRTAAAFGGSFLCLTLLSTLGAPDWSNVRLDLTGSALTFLVLALVPGLVNRYRTQRRLLLKALRDHNAQLLRERGWVAEQARIRERQRIAHDMHDSLGHQLVLIAVHAGALEVDPTLGEAGHTAAGVVRKASAAAMDELRSVVGMLALPTGSGAAPSPNGSAGVGGIGELVAVAATTGTPVRMEESGMPRPMSTASSHAAYRIVQEGLTNAYKHAPGAAIAVRLCYEPDALLVEVGNGPVPPGDRDGLAGTGGGQGLTGLQERIRLAGGMLHTGPTGDGGFRLAGVLPYQPAAAGGSAPAVHAPQEFPGESDPDEGFAPTEKNRKGKKAKGCLAGCGVALAVLLVIGVAGFFGVSKVVSQVGSNLVSRTTYDSVQLGQSETAVRQELPSGRSLLITALDGKLPADPPGQTCLDLMAEGTPAKPLLGKVQTVFRFCFQGGRLVGKREIDVTN
ncbi:signal transduction histidine kinase [Streptomyces sp. 846.5]|nr:histidine kinase [Streptomyces sp. 846.5]TDT98003.1 signal transduction histidine kinase [Streptomyces sp. 846.5]